MESMDEALLVLGIEPSAAVYQYLVTICSLPKQDIPDRIEDFDNGIKKALGAASKVIERLIVRKLFQKLSLSLRESQDQDFLDYIQDARRRYEVFSHRQAGLLDSERSQKGKISS
jgi:hypothetical protein